MSTRTTGRNARDAPKVKLAVGSFSEQPTIALSVTQRSTSPTANTEELAMRLALAGYRVDGFLASGRHGPIYRGVRHTDGLGVTIHVVETPLSAQQRQRFLTESAPLLRLPASPHLVPVLDAALTETGDPCLVTAAGEETLADRLQAGGTIPLVELAGAARAAADGLEALHRAGLLHANLSPGNLLLLPNGRVALTGVAVPVLAELVAATPSPYHPPEVLGGDAWCVAGDVYALAATLYALLTGAPPHGSSDGAVLRALAGEAPDLDRGGLPEAVRAALGRALDPEPAARQQSPVALADELVVAIPAAPMESMIEQTLPPPAHAGDPDGRALGSNYLLHEPIGRGASGQVWRASRRDDGSPVAVKLLRREHAANPEMVARFLRERTALLSVAHPNLVRVRDVVAEGEVLALVMDLVDGTDLRRTLALGGLRRGEALVVLGQVAAALAAVHAAGIVHRDVKPENVLVERTERAGRRPGARLTDFGIAHAAAASALTRTDQLLGTVDYLAPEVTGGERATPAADVYAFGVVAYEVLAGRRPFTGEHPFAVARAQLEREPPRPDGMADDLWQVLSSCLAKDPATRPAAAALATTFQWMVPDLADAAAPLPVPAAPPATPAPSASPAPPVASAPPAASALAAGPKGPAAALSAPEPLETGVSRLPPPPAPDQPAERGGRRPLLLWVAVVVAAAALAASAGVWAAERGKTAGRPAPTTVAEATRFVPVPVVASTPRPGTVVLRFSGGPELDGFQHYTIFWNGGRVLQSGIPGSDTERAVTDLDPGTEYCFQVGALVVGDATTKAPAPGQKRPEACLRPTGSAD